MLHILSVVQALLMGVMRILGGKRTLETGALSQEGAGRSKQEGVCEAQTLTTCSEASQHLCGGARLLLTQMGNRASKAMQARKKVPSRFPNLPPGTAAVSLARPRCTPGMEEGVSPGK